jgi:hypothetical protein
VGKKKDKKPSKKSVRADVKKAKAESAATAEKLDTAPKKKAKAIEIKTHKPAEEKRVNTAGLPESVLKHKLIGKSTISDGTQKITLAEVTGTSRSIYVNDIHSANPVVLAEHFWIGCIGQRWPVVRVEKDEYEFVLKHTQGRLPKNSHIICVVDCSIDPTLSYGFYLDELPHGFPTLDQIKQKDAEFRKNPTTVHNQSVKLVIEEKQQTKVAQQEEELLEFSDDEGSNEEPGGEEEDFVFDD